MEGAGGHRSSWAILGHQGETGQQRSHQVSPEISKAQTQVSEIADVQENDTPMPPSRLWPGEGCACHRWF